MTSSQREEDERAKALGMILRVSGTYFHPAAHPAYETLAKEAETTQVLNFNV